MDEQRVPNLEELDEQQAQHFLTELFSYLSAEEEYQIRHEDYTLEMPQSGERIRGREKMRAFQEAYPNPPSIKIRRVLARDGLRVVEGVNDYGRRHRSGGRSGPKVRQHPWTNKRPAANIRVPSRAALVIPVRFPGRPCVSPAYPLGSLPASLAGLSQRPNQPVLVQGP